MADENGQQKPIVITVTLPVDGSGIGQLVGNKGAQGVVRRFAYTGVDDVANAVQQAAWDLVEQEIEPPYVPAVVDE